MSGGISLLRFLILFLSVFMIGARYKADVRATEGNSRRFLRELDEAPRGNNLQYILKCPCIPFFGNWGLHNEIMLGGNGGRSGVMCEGSPYSCPSDRCVLSHERVGYMVENIHQLNLSPRSPLIHSRELHLQP